jgi:dCMP deaminase
VEIPHFEECDILPPTLRDAGGFGSTGLYEIALGDATYRREQLRWDKHFMGLAISAAGLSNCLRGAKRIEGKYLKDGEGRYLGATRRFGCVIVKGHNVVAQGFNMQTRDCSEEKGCIREREGIPSGSANDKGCLHAEQVAVQNYAQTGGASLEGATVYVNSEPCVMCAKLLLGCRIGAIVVPRGVYPTHGLPLLTDAGVEIRYVELEPAVASAPVR